MPEESSEPRLVVEERVSTRLPTENGEFRLYLYTSNLDRTESLALVRGDVRDQELVLVRVHSECLTGDVLGSLRCDCAGQLETALQLIAREGRGALVYLRQEGRGIGLREKLLAYNLQDAGLDTVDANLRLGHASDSRDYAVAAEILRLLGVRSIRLMTNNPGKIQELERLGVNVAERVPIPPIVNNENRRYLITKATRMGHLFQVG